MLHPVLTAAAAVAGLAAGLLIGTHLDFLYTTAQEPASQELRRKRLLFLGPATMLLATLAAFKAGSLLQFLLISAFGVALIALSATDFERRLLPNRVMYPCLLAALLLSWLWPTRPPLSGLVGGLVGGGIMLAVFLVVPGFGFGDVKLAALIGLILGFPAVISGLFLGVILGGLAATYLLLSKRARIGSAMAYGPYLASGAILVMLFRR